jgi:hypothetical protein
MSEITLSISIKSVFGGQAKSYQANSILVIGGQTETAFKKIILNFNTFLKKRS